MKKMVEAMAIRLSRPLCLACGLALLFPILASCSSVQAPTLQSGAVKDAADAGSVHVAVISVMPLDEVVDALQPQFDLDSKGALEQAIPATQQVTEKVLDILRASAGVALPTSSITSSQTTTEQTGSAPTRTSTRTEQRTPGDVTKATAPDVGAGQDVSKLPGSLTAFDPSKAVDAMLRYQAASALYQEVQLLNRSVKNIVERKGFTAYVIRLQVSVIPHGRIRPYDTYVNVSFFPETPDDGETNPTVVPLLVTDDLEGLSHERADQSARQAALSILATVQGVGASADLGKLNQQLRNIVGRDLNSLLTVAKMSDNTVRIRLGAEAAQVNPAGYAIVPRNHSVSLVVLIPEKMKEVRVIARSDFRDVTTGEEVSGERTLSDWDPETKRFNEIYGKGAGALSWVEPFDSGDLFRLSRAVYANDFQEYRQMLQPRMGGQAAAGPKDGWSREQLRLATYIWADIQRTQVRSRFSHAQFSVPDRKTSVCPFDQTAILSDDGKAGSVQLIGGSNMSAHRIAALMSLGGSGDCKLDIAPTITVSADGSTLNAGLPSLKAMNRVSCLGGKSRFVIHSGCKAPNESGYALAYVASTGGDGAKAKPGLASTSSIIVSDEKGRGSVELLVDPAKSKKPLFVQITGADVTDVSAGGAVERSGAKLAIKRAGLITLQLANLSTQADVVFVLADEEGKLLSDATRIRVTHGQINGK